MAGHSASETMSESGWEIRIRRDNSVPDWSRKHPPFIGEINSIDLQYRQHLVAVLDGVDMSEHSHLLFVSPCLIFKHLFVHSFSIAIGGEKRLIERIQQIVQLTALFLA